MSSPRAPDKTTISRAKAYSALLYHVGSFVIINAFFWILDLSIGQSGVQWALWITLFWGLALVLHVMAYVVGTAESRKIKKLIDLQSQDRTPQPQ